MDYGKLSVALTEYINTVPKDKIDSEDIDVLVHISDGCSMKVREVIRRTVSKKIIDWLSRQYDTILIELCSEYRLPIPDFAFSITRFKGSSS